MIREGDYDKTRIRSILQEDPIARNPTLNTFIGLLNSINGNSLLTIDGGWGSGKTIFVKQIEYLNSCDLSKERFPGLDTVEKFQDEYITYYYDAWKNDYHEDPLQSLLFNLINDLWGARERTADAVVKVSTAFRNSVIKTVSVGLFDPDEIRKAANISDLVKSITTSKERRDAIDDIINNHLDLGGKKLLFIVDELDRCKPSFAVKLLEALKHYYTNDKLVFLLSTNNQQLAHTIKKVYGESFDGAGYLNRFYDLIFNLPRVKTDDYIKYLGNNTNSGYLKDIVPSEVVKYLDLTMREINRYYSSLKLIDDYLASIDTAAVSISAQLVKYVFIPLAYGLRVHKFDDYIKFINGGGESILEAFSRKSNVLSRIATKSSQGTDRGAIEIIKEIYNKICTYNDESNIDDYDIINSANTFNRVILLMNSSGAIDNSLEGE